MNHECERGSVPGVGAGLPEQRRVGVDRGAQHSSQSCGPSPLLLLQHLQMMSDEVGKKILLNGNLHLIDNITSLHPLQVSQRLLSTKSGWGHSAHTRPGVNIQ